MEMETEIHLRQTHIINDIRTIHNNIKHDIIREGYIHILYKIPIENVIVLDFACGHGGGDMHKFYYNNYNKVIGVDNHVLHSRLHNDGISIATKTKPQKEGNHS